MNNNQRKWNRSIKSQSRCQKNQMLVNDTKIVEHRQVIYIQKVIQKEL